MTNAAAVGSITEAMMDALRGTKPWVLLIGILMFVGAAFLSAPRL